MNRRHQIRQYLKLVSEFLAVAAPIICLFDCVVLPVLSAILPFVGIQHFVHGISDQFITALVLAICLPVLIPGIIKHKNKSVALMFSGAICLMLFTNFMGERIDQWLHISLTIATSILLIRSNWLNKQLLKAISPCACAHHHHHDTETAPVAVKIELTTAR